LERHIHYSLTGDAWEYLGAAYSHFISALV
jgi:hypothetical protein